MLKTFLNNRFQDLKASLTTKPSRRDIVFSATVFFMYMAIALTAGFLTGFLEVRILRTKTWMMILLPLWLLIMPSLIEEVFFRALLLPHKKRQPPIGTQILFSLLSIITFIAWHPLNAVTINQEAYPVFTNPVFLILAALMAIACTITYLKSGSLWIPVSIHWLTVLAWVYFLGGRNVVLD